MAGAQHLLRKAAIERMSSPEQLDMAMRVTSPAGWVALIALGTIVLAAVLGSIFFLVPVRVDGSGMLLRDVRTIEVTAKGSVKSIEVEVGSIVEQGDVVALLDLPDLESEISRLNESVAELDAQFAIRQAGYLRSIRDFESQIRAEQRRLELMKPRVPETYNRMDLRKSEEKIADFRLRKNQAEQAERTLQNQAAEQRRKLEQLEKQFQNNAEIVSEHGGRVLSLFKRPGQLVGEREQLMNLEDPDAPFQALIYVPYADGPRVSPEMEVRLSPSTVKREEYGFILGDIVSRSESPVSYQEVRSRLVHEELAKKFSQETPYEVRGLVRHDDTASGFEWTSGKGPPNSVLSNTPCTAQIIVDRKRPIEFVIPALKGLLGMN